jgi:hypothetical protein
VDPSHATGKRWLVKPLAIGGVAVGADGVMVEVHPRPDEALSDAEQQITLDQFAAMMVALTKVHEQVRGMHGDPLAGPGSCSRAPWTATNARGPVPICASMRPALFRSCSKSQGVPGILS